ncbi:hypothetical protein [Streptomyces sp. NPDC051567]
MNGECSSAGFILLEPTRQRATSAGADERVDGLVDELVGKRVCAPTGRWR